MCRIDTRSWLLGDVSLTLLDDVTTSDVVAMLRAVGERTTALLAEHYGSEGITGF